LEPAVSKRSPQPARKSGTSPGGPPAATDDELSSEDDFELVPLGQNEDFGESVTAGQGWVDRSMQVETPWPTGRTKTADQLSVDGVEVELVAGYGRPPQNAVLTPLYAYRVFTRQRQLRLQVSQLNQQLSRAEAERDGLLARLATSLRPVLEASDTFRRLLEPIREVERLRGDRSAALSEADAGYREQMAKFDQELARLRAVQTSAKSASAEKRGVRENAENEFRRADAKHKRAQIEMRGVLDLARKALGPAGGDIPPAQAKQLAELQAQAAALEPEVARTRAALTVASTAFDQAEGEVQRVQAELKKVERQKAGIGGSLEKQLSVRAAGVSEAEKQQRDALAEVARAVLASHGALEVPTPELETLTGQDARINALALRLETHLRALDSQDRGRVKLGVSIALGAVGLVVLAILLRAVL